jgi:hypothetical protein
METEIIYACTSGVGELFHWTHSNYAWDTTSGTYAVCAAIDSESDYKIYGYTTATGGGTITKVEIGVSGYVTGYFYWANIGTSFSGARYTVSSDYHIPFTNTWDTCWFDITSSTDSPPMLESREWNNSDINYANLFVYTHAFSPFSMFLTTKCYIDQLYWRITYSG